MNNANDKIIRLITEEISKKDLMSAIKGNKDFEKEVKRIVTDVVINMYRILWQNSSMLKSLSN